MMLVPPEDQGTSAADTLAPDRLILLAPFLCDGVLLLSWKALDPTRQNGRALQKGLACQRNSLLGC